MHTSTIRTSGDGSRDSRLAGCWTWHPRLMTLSRVQGCPAAVSGREGAVVPVPGRRTPAASSLQSWFAAGVWQD
jgi:hypothetical protein